MYKKIMSLAVLLGFSNLSMATVHLCPVTPKFSNGCSFDYIGESYGELAESTLELLASPYSGDFQASCNLHDICYQTVGKTRKACDHEFRENLYDECGIDFACKGVADVFVEGVQNNGLNPYNDGIRDAIDIAAQAESNIETLSPQEDENCVTTPKYTDRYNPDMLDYVRNEFNSRVGRNPTTEEFILLNLYTLNENDSDDDYTNWESEVISRIQTDYLNTSGPEAIYYKQSVIDPMGWVHAFILDGSFSKGQPVSYKWHMAHNHQEEFDKDIRKNTPPAGGMMYIDGYLRVDNTDGKDYIIFDESFYVNSCTSTPCNIEP